MSNPSNLTPRRVDLPSVDDADVPAGSNDNDALTTMAQRTYDLLREALLNGEFLPGQSISLAQHRRGPRHQPDAGSPGVEPAAVPSAFW